MNENVIHFNKKRNYKRIQKDMVVRLRYLMRDVESDETLAYRDDMYYLHGGYGSAFPKVEAALEGLEVDMKTEVTLAPKDSYGEINTDLLMKVPAEVIPTEAHKVGTELEGEGEDGSSKTFRVIEIDNEGITLDGNHPMAGKTLGFVFEVMDIREASAEEIEAGYAFPPEEC